MGNPLPDVRAADCALCARRIPDDHLPPRRVSFSKGNLVAHGEEYAKKIAGRSKVRVRIPSVRGEIRDRHGVPLVQNRASYDVDFYLPYMVRGYRERNGEVPIIGFQQPVRGMLKNKQEA